MRIAPPSIHSMMDLDCNCAGRQNICYGNSDGAASSLRRFICGRRVAHAFELYQARKRNTMQLQPSERSGNNIRECVLSRVSK